MISKGYAGFAETILLSGSAYLSLNCARILEYWETYAQSIRYAYALS